MQAVRPVADSAPSYGGFHAPPSPSAHGGPRRYEAMQMPAVELPPSSGRMLDDDLSFDFDLDADGALELDGRPSSHRTRVETSRSPMLDAPPPRGMTPSPMARVTPSPMARVTPGSMARVTATATPAASATGPRTTTSGEMLLPPAPPWPMQAPPGRRSSSTLAAVDPHAALIAFAGFGEPPETIWGAPAYALRVVLRRRALRGNLELARRHRSADVGLYEASLRAADDAAVRNGLVFAAAISGVVVLLAGATVQLVTGALPLPW